MARSGRLAMTWTAGIVLLASACSAGREPAADLTQLDMGVCLDAIAASNGGEGDVGRGGGSGSVGADPAACPSFLLATAVDAAELCREAGGVIGPIEAADIWSLDVDGDGRPEHAYAIDEVVYCAGAASLYSCGSLGCPKALYGERDGAWHFLGSLSAPSREAIEVSDSTGADGYRDLLVGCGAGEECAARWLYAWRGGAYEPVSAEVRGHRVDYAGSVHGLFALAAETTLLATPAAEGEPLDRYAAGTEVAIIGTAGAYYYVSPCNACESGFVPAATIPSAR